MSRNLAFVSDDRFSPFYILSVDELQTQLILIMSTIVKLRFLTGSVAIKALIVHTSMIVPSLCDNGEELISDAESSACQIKKSSAQIPPARILPRQNLEQNIYPIRLRRTSLSIQPLDGEDCVRYISQAVQRAIVA